MLPQINYDRKFLAKLKSNYFNAKALYETVKENAEERFLQKMSSMRQKKLQK